MTAPLHAFFLRTDQHKLETLVESLLDVHLEEAWLHLAAVQEIPWGTGPCLQLELYHLRDGVPIVPEMLGALLSRGERIALRLSVDSERTSVAYEVFRDGQPGPAWAGDVECFESDDRRPKRERNPADLAACRQRFARRFREDTGLDFDALASSPASRDDAAEVAGEDTLILVRGRLVKPAEGMGRWSELFRFHDRNAGVEGEPKHEHVLLVGLDLKSAERLWRRTPASQVYQFLRMIEPSKQSVLGPLAHLLPEVLGAVEALAPEQPLEGAELDLSVFEVLAMSTALVFMVGDRVSYLDERFFPLLSLAEGPAARAALEESAEEIAELGVLGAMTEVLPYSVPEGELLQSVDDAELSPLAPWAVTGDSYEGSLLLLDPTRLRELVEEFDIDELKERIEEFRRAWREVAEPTGNAASAWLAERRERDETELSRFEDTFVELQHALALAEGNELRVGLLFYSE